MPNHMRCIGFDVRTQDEFLELAQRSVVEGRGFAAGEDCYLFAWRVGDGVELWTQVGPGGESLLGMNPHFFGRARMRVGLTERVPPSYEGSLDGAFYGWLDPETDENPEGGWCPVVFDAPNYASLEGLELPLVCDVQFAAFPHELRVFSSEEKNFDSQEEGPRMGSEMFILSGTFRPGGGRIEPPVAAAIFAGTVLEAQTITNTDTGLRFDHAKVKTLGGEVDLVVSPDDPTGNPLRPGAVVRGSFWLSGLLLN